VAQQLSSIVMSGWVKGQGGSSLICMNLSTVSPFWSLSWILLEVGKFLREAVLMKYHATGASTLSVTYLGRRLTRQFHGRTAVAHYEQISSFDVPFVEDLSLWTSNNCPLAKRECNHKVYDLIHMTSKQ